MARKYDKIILQVKKPSKKSFLIGIPMSLYRIQSHDYSEGINFFQKAILKFKQRKDIQDSYISSLLSIDEKLVSIIESELVEMKMLTSDGDITEEGLKACGYTEGLIINSQKKKIGYIFKYNNNNDYYPYYINEFENRNVFSREPFKVILMQKDNESGEEKEYYSDEITIVDNEEDNIIWGNNPNPINALEIMTKTSLKENSNYEPEDCERLSINFIPDNKPSNALVCTYVYLPQIEGDLYSSDWQILDPFGYGNNIQLKFFIESCNDQFLKQKIHDEFSSAPTGESLIYKEFQNLINNKIPLIIEKDFGESYQALDQTKATYLYLIIKTRLCMEYEGYESRDNCDSFASYLQQLLEGILKDDKAKRKEDYDNVKCLGMGILVGTKLHAICTTKLGMKKVPSNLLAQKDNKKGKALMFYLMEFLLTCEDKTPKLLNVLKDHIETICDLALDRNSRQHYGLPELMTMNEVEKYYNCIKQIINNYKKNG